MNTNIKCLLIDLDNTLAPFDFNKGAKYAALKSLKPTWIIAAYINSPNFLPDKLIEISKKGLHNNDIHDGIDIKLSRAFGKARDNLPLSHITINKNLRKSLINAQNSGIELAILTASSKERATKVLNHLGILDLFEGKIFSARDKKYEDSYLRIIKKELTHLEPQSIAFLDDTKENIEAAWRAGLQTSHIDNHKLPVHHVINDYVDKKIQYHLKISPGMS